MWYVLESVSGRVYFANCIDDTQANILAVCGSQEEAVEVIRSF